ncbi:MAG: galactose-1-phosphate uridylyltransferase [Herpetosiphonaceae bacterium]|nr:MAG: galactose-1-phosphate uridylyltransferase [Herpetosiphonaceae bacterium]
MPEIRQNIATREWVIIATERAKRPEEFIRHDRGWREDRPAFDASCPFCPGNEELELERLRLPEEGPWQLRVVTNKYPALQETGERLRHFHGVYRAISGVGYHEVVIESRLHNSSPAETEPESLERVLTAFQIRGRIIESDPRIEQTVFFKNHGRRAGTSLIHPHGQLVGLPIVPYNIRVRNEEARRNFDDHGECVFCRMRLEEEIDGKRIIASSDYFTAFIPYAAYSPFHIWIVPRRHHASFLDAAPDEIRDLSVVLRQVLRRLFIGLNNPDYNYIIRSAPKQESCSLYLHWYMSIVTHVTRMAGFEMGSGMFINTALPEESAAFLRSIEV